MRFANITYISLCCVKQAHQFTTKKILKGFVRNIQIPKPVLDIKYLCNPKHKLEIEQNIRNRKGVGNISRVMELYTKLTNGSFTEEEKIDLQNEFESEAQQIPNKSSPVVSHYGETPKIVNTVGSKQSFNFKPKEFSDITNSLHMARTENLSNLAGHKSYYYMGELAELEQALIQFTVKGLLSRDFQLVSVPDILPAQIIEGCGMKTQGDRTQVYKLDPHLYEGDLCLSGTSEMALAAFVMNQEFKEKELPFKLAAVSRCYRAETSRLSEEKGVYRVHQFTKVEMFGVTTQESSGDFLEELRSLQEEAFTSLGLHFLTLDMPPHELGAPAFRKYDVEAWMPGRGMYGEVSSCSDCTDYQSRRLNIKYRQSGSDIAIHAHTVNGTACAIPRTLIALLETHQREDGSVEIPQPLRCYMRGKTIIQQQDSIPVFKFMKSKQRTSKD